MLRIDYVLSTPDLVPMSATVDCSLRSDHFRVDVELTMTRTSTSPDVDLLPPLPGGRLPQPEQAGRPR